MSFFPNGRCWDCGKTDERTIAGRWRCAECAAKNNETVKKIYRQRIAEHRCITCGAQDARTLSGKTNCAPCAKFTNAKQRMRYRARKKATEKGA